MEPSGDSPQYEGPRRRPVTLNPLDALRYRLDELPEHLWQGQVRQAFWKGATLLSLVVNVVLLAVVLSLGRNIFALKALVTPLLSGLDTGFAQMDAAHIRTEIQVDSQVPISFDLPIHQDTLVILTEPTRIEGAQVVIQTPGFTVNAPATVTLPVGTRLPIALDMTVPVQSEIPVTLQVPVDIAMEATELNRPFSEMGGLIGRYRSVVDSLPDCWADLLWGGACQ